MNSNPDPENPADPTHRKAAAPRSADRSCFRWPGLVPVLGSLLLFHLFNGAAPADRARPPRVRKPDKAWISAKGVCCFPLSNDFVPPTGKQLVESMTGGWRDVFALPDPARVVEIEGGRYPAVDSLRVDLSRAVINPKHKPAKLGDPTPTTKGVAVEHFEMIAAPMISEKSKLNLQVTGTGVRLDLQHDKDGNPLLMLADAREGMLRFDIGHDDFEKLVLYTVKSQASRHAIAVRSTDLDLRSIGPRSLTADLHVSTRVGFVPAGLRFTARVDVDERMNARISNLACEGDELLGPLIVNFIRPGLSRYNNTTRPLLSFPTGNLHLRDVEIRAGERVEMTAKFSS